MINAKLLEGDRTYYCTDCGELLGEGDLVNGTCPCNPMFDLIVISKKVRYEEYKTSNKIQREFFYKLKNMCYSSTSKYPIIEVVEMAKRAYLLEINEEGNMRLIEELDTTIRTNLTPFLINLTLFEGLELSIEEGVCGDKLIDLLGICRLVGLRVAKSPNYHSVHSMQSVLESYIELIKRPKGTYPSLFSTSS